MDKLNLSAYFRSMSLFEYKKWRELDKIEIGKDWTETRISDSGRGYPLSELKRWVDNGGNEWGSHDVVVEVQGAKCLEFLLASVGEHHDYVGEGGDGLNDYASSFMLPYRYKNMIPIAFQRISLIYDPRALVLEEPSLLLNDLIKKKNASILSTFISYLGKRIMTKILS